MTVPWYRRAGFDVQEFAVNGVRTFAVVEGRRDAFPVVFLHGFPGGAFIWEYVIAALGRRRLAIAPDFPGWGGSVSQFGSELPPPTPEWALQWLTGLLSAQHVERFDLVAHGCAAWMALEMLVRDPARVRRLALVSPKLWTDAAERFRTPRLFGRRNAWSGERVRKWLDEHGALQAAARERSGQLFVQMGQRERPPEILNERPYRARFDTYRQALAAYRGAVQVMWGVDNPAHSLPHSEELVAVMDRPEVHRITRAGYFPMLDQPQTVTPILREFLED